MKPGLRIAIVLTCHNRKQLTKVSLKSLFRFAPQNLELRIFLCDDGSTDGTAAEISDSFPNVTIVKGDGNLFWARGMARAMKVAETIKPDFYLMINDDVVFEKDALKIMLNSYESVKTLDVAVSGATKSAITDEYTYGGKIEIGNLRKVVKPSTPCNACDLANWNCFLLPRELYEKVGKVDDFYAHSYADYDYSHRIYQSGGKIVVASNYIGTCELNDIKNTWQDSNLRPMQRLRLLQKRTGLPISSQIHYYRKFYKRKWLIKVMKPYLVILKDGLRL